ncbi:MULTISPECIES: ABC transporter permease [Paenibacillus]|uniref:ABC transporter permease subunit n=1 Tax=Paenibacillus woosongensis TaxID=307580 RepID=A0A7X2YXY2_9BACL|nr:ABC transporter permease [Paenibacillus woosongensis]MUG44026.1 ABC transporter permease subunit [Paenibacillus woosongensis]
MDWRRILINPVMDKEFRLRMRTSRSAVTVFAYVLVMGLLAMGIIYVMMSSGAGLSGRIDPGTSRVMFYALSIAQLVLIAFMTPALTAGVISGEREKQTLNMLLTTQQSSSTIILSKLVSSLSFMTLVILATLPVYSIAFLYGGVAPKQLVFVFLFYLFIMLLLGSLGVLFSTLFKRTIVAVIMTYGVGLVIFLITGIIYLLAMGVVQANYYASGTTMAPDYSWIGFILGLNPAGALISIFEPSFSDSIFLTRWGSQQAGAPIQLWQEFLLVYSVVIILALWLAIRYIRPVRRVRIKKRLQTDWEPQEHEQAEK